MNSYVRFVIAASIAHAVIVWGFFFWEKANVVENDYCRTGKITDVELPGIDVNHGLIIATEKEYLFTVAMRNGHLVTLKEFSLTALLSKAMEISAESADERCTPVLSAWRIETADPYYGLSDRTLEILRKMEADDAPEEIVLEYLSVENIDVRVARFILVPRINAFILLWLLPLVAFWVLSGIALWIRVGFRRAPI